MDDGIHSLLAYVLVFPTFFRFVQWLTYPFVGDQQAQYDIVYWFCDENGCVVILGP